MFTTTSARTSAYERLENGISSNRQSSSSLRKLAWKKIAIGCAVLMGLVWFFGPRKDVATANILPPGLDDNDIIYPPESVIPTQPSSDTSPSSSSPLPVSGTISIPTSPETDPDPLKTVHCTEPYAPHLPLVQYALMIDAGSTGSRIHIYKFHNCFPPSSSSSSSSSGSSSSPPPAPAPAYEYEVFRMTQPGLSDLRTHGSPAGSAASLDVLLDEAVRVVPASLHACTPVAVKATAGLRLLGAEKSGEILEAVGRRLRERYPFRVVGEGKKGGDGVEGGGVTVMDGREEGVYAWMTVNYLMGTVGGGGGLSAGEEEDDDDDDDQKTATYAVLDLGGGSTQIVFEPEKGEDVALRDGEHKYALTIGGRERVLYQHSYLGYGLKSARESVHRVVEFMDALRSGAAQESDGDGDDAPRWVPNPCLAQKTTKEVDVPLGEGKGKVKVLMAGEDVGSFEACNRVLELVMAKDATCEVKPCSFNGVYQPSLLDAFPKGNVLLLSYFYDRIMPLISTDDDRPQPKITVSTIATLARRVCAGPSSWREHWGGGEGGTSPAGVMEELQDRPEWCLDLTFMHALLGLGYEFTDGRRMELGKRIRGTELGWCLGATIAMVSGTEVTECAA